MSDVIGDVIINFGQISHIFLVNRKLLTLNKYILARKSCATVLSLPSCLLPRKKVVLISFLSLKTARSGNYPTFPCTHLITLKY